MSLDVSLKDWDQNEPTRILVVPEGLLGDEIGESFLDRRAIQVRTAVDATQALATAEIFRPHLVVYRSDLREPIGAFYRALAADAPGRLPKLVMVTEQLHDGDAADGLYDAHLLCPLEPEQVLVTIAELLEIQARRHDRVPLDVLVHTEGFVEDGAAVDATLATAHSLSEDSILLEASRQLTLQSRGKLQFFLPASSERLTLDGIVRVSVDEVRLHYVIDLLDLAPQHRAMIRRYVESQREAA